MRVIEGFNAHPGAARAVQRRRLLRRAAIRVASAGAPCHPIETLAQGPRDRSLAYTPRLSPSVQRTGTRLTSEPFVLLLDAFERALVSACDGQRTIAHLVDLALAEHPDAAEPSRTALKLFAGLGRYGMLDLTPPRRALAAPDAVDEGAH